VISVAVFAIVSELCGDEIPEEVHNSEVSLVNLRNLSKKGKKRELWEEETSPRIVVISSSSLFLIFVS